MRKLIITACIIIGLYSCKKKETPKPQPQNTPQYSEDVYVRQVSNPPRCGEPDTLWVMNNNGVTTLSCPMIAYSQDTVTAPNFNHQMRQYPLILNGGYTITANILKLSYTQYNTILNQYGSCSVSNVLYQKQ